jgi:hypothetical protein
MYKITIFSIRAFSLPEVLFYFHAQILSAGERREKMYALYIILTYSFSFIFFYDNTELDFAVFIIIE